MQVQAEQTAASEAAQLAAECLAKEQAKALEQIRIKDSQIVAANEAVAATQMQMREELEAQRLQAAASEDALAHKLRGEMATQAEAAAENLAITNSEWKQQVVTFHVFSQPLSTPPAVGHTP